MPKEGHRLLGPLTEADKRREEDGSGFGATEGKKAGVAGVFNDGFVSALGAWHFWDRVKRLTSKSSEKEEMVVAAYVLT